MKVITLETLKSLKKINMSKTSSIFDCSIITLDKNHRVKGNLTVINNFSELPFDVKRVYFLYDVPGGEARGGHAHKELQQLIVAASGSFDLIVDDGKVKRTFHLNRPYQGILMPSGLWRELNNFSSGSICLVLASHEYNLVCHDELVSGAKYDTVVLGVAHKEFLNLDLELLKRENAVVYDVKGILQGSDGKL